MYPGILVFMYTNDSYMNTLIHEYKDTNEYKDTWIHEYMDTWIHEYKDTNE